MSISSTCGARSAALRTASTSLPSVWVRVTKDGTMPTHRGWRAHLTRRKAPHTTGAAGMPPGWRIFTRMMKCNHEHRDGNRDPRGS